MPRPKRLNIAGVPQHITQRGNNRQACFFRDSDRAVYLELLAAAVRRRHCAIHAYVLMTNHVHLLATPRVPDGLSRTMQDLGREYVRYVNSTYQRTGTLWEGRFKSSLVDTETYCLTCYRYIELNPVRANLVIDPAAYPWSSYHFNALGVADPLITPHPLWTGLGADGATRRTAYRELFAEALSDESVEAIRYNNRKGLPLGSERFRARVENQLGLKLGTGAVGRPRKQQ